MIESPIKQRADLQSYPLFPKPFPHAWAGDWGEDSQGLWMSLILRGVRQSFRWIAPGRFMMGSPKDEPERYDDELQHEVILTKGFWLADTTCTQGLWSAVMGGNPSEFKGERRPVENVSWDDCQKFLEKINGLVPDLELRLPMEAEWEYACRAGTETPFSFGENITTDQVNYDGNNPYAGGKKGEYRQETVEVKSLLGNSWGLYEMHGNVWEWCSDWEGEYPKERVVDPTGPEKGSGRVLRGGSWIRVGRNARSASRFARRPASRNSFYGFRLARGQ